MSLQDEVDRAQIRKVQDAAWDDLYDTWCALEREIDAFFDKRFKDKDPVRQAMVLSYVIEHLAERQRMAVELAVVGPEHLSSSTWERRTGIVVKDPDGWDRSHGTEAYEASWNEPITRKEFLERAASSTVGRWPSPLLDERD